MTQKCKDKKIFEKSDYHFLLLSLIPTDENHHLLRQLVLIVPSITTLFLESLQEIDEESRKLALFQLKLDIERDLSLYTNKIWEKMRFENIGDPYNLTLYGSCKACGSEYPFQVDILRFLKLPNIYACDSNGEFIIQHIDCFLCHAKDSLSIFPSWLRSWFSQSFSFKPSVVQKA